MTTSSHNAPFRSVGHLDLYEPFLQLMEQVPETAQPVNELVVSRYSTAGKGVGEQASKVTALHRDQVPALKVLQATVPDEVWGRADSRARHGIIEVRVADVMPERDPGDKYGKDVVGYITAVENVIAFRVAASAYKTIAVPGGEGRNAYTQAMIELLKWVRAHAGSRDIFLRVSDDTTRGTRQHLEGTRIAFWIERLDIRWMKGNREAETGGIHTIVNSIESAGAEMDRRTSMDHITKGLLAATTKGAIPYSEVNLPPFLSHVHDPDTLTMDGRRRDGSHLMVQWVVDMAPALWAYTEAFARGAMPAELADILIAHQVPTPAVGISKQGARRYSSRRDSTFDQLPRAEARARASRWLEYSDNHFKPPFTGMTEEEAEDQSESNRLALRKFSLLIDGEFEYRLKNPTREQDRYGEFEVERKYGHDVGVLRSTVHFPWPAKRVVRTGANGLPTVTDELELDEHGNTVPWAHLGCSPGILRACIQRIQERAERGGKRTRTTDSPRLLTINRWITTRDDGVQLQWTATKRGAISSREFWRYRWLISRPAPNQQHPTRDLHLDWPLALREVSGSAGPTDRSIGAIHHATIREDLLLLWATSALRTELLEVLDSDVAVEMSQPAVVAAALAQTQAAATAATAEALQSSQRANGFLNYAAEANAVGNTAKEEDMLRRHADALADAQAHTARAERLGRSAASPSTVETSAELNVHTIADLLELMCRYATPASGGMGPPALAKVLEQMFTHWSFRCLGPAVEVRCTAMVPTVGSETIEVTLTGSLPNNTYRQETSEGERVLRRLANGSSFDDIVRTGMGPGSRSTLRTVRLATRNALTNKGVSNHRVTALMDHPHPDALQLMCAAVLGEPVPDARWTDAFQDHMRHVYANGSWAKSAVPPPCNEALQRVFAVIRQRPTGISIAELCTTADVDRTFIIGLVNPQIGIRQFGRLRMLEWVPGREDAFVRAIPCPHRDCPGPVRTASTAAMLPETVANGYDFGGVICPECSRLPFAEYSTIRFPSSWHRPIAFVPTDAASGQWRHSTVIEARVPRIGRDLERVTAAELAAAYSISSDDAESICQERAVSFIDISRGKRRNLRLYDSAAAGTAMRWAVKPGRGAGLTEA